MMIEGIFHLKGYCMEIINPPSYCAGLTVFQHCLVDGMEWVVAMSLCSIHRQDKADWFRYVSYIWDASYDISNILFAIYLIYVSFDSYTW